MFIRNTLHNQEQQKTSDLFFNINSRKSYHNSIL